MDMSDPGESRWDDPEGREISPRLRAGIALGSHIVTAALILGFVFLLAYALQVLASISPIYSSIGVPIVMFMIAAKLGFPMESLRQKYTDRVVDALDQRLKG